jgi:hypothetical protein
MPQQGLRNWGYRQDLYSTPAQKDPSSIEELPDFGKPMEDESSISGIFVDILTKMLMLMLLLVCLAVMGFCIYRLAHSITPALKQMVCEAPVAAAPAQPAAPKSK